ncbi:SWIM-type domain-containing protein [Trichonephila clavata]|uniref:SWIM-type domain-containing protein n=1 Tax=Trichonephila clavata TaxID=2740835 RepID=A0A8X6GU18_TRICU|nr:SWIM-type domain-containing protein [Trichonephila clavata]
MISKLPWRCWHTLAAWRQNTFPRMRSAPYHIAVVWKLDKMEFQQEIIQKNYIVSQLQEIYPYCIEDTDKSTPEQIVLRTNLQNEEEAENFKKQYSAISNTNWIVYNYNPNPQKFVFSKTWLCHHSKRHKRIAKRNADCKAKLSIVIKKITKATKKTDKYLKYDMPLVGEVKISLLHTHNTTSAETLRMLRVNDEVSQQFYQYFSDGMSPIEAIRFHENKFLLEDNFMGLANASLNPTHNQIYYLHECWRDTNLGSSINPFDKLKEKVPFYESIGTTVKFHDDHLWAVLLVTPLMKRNHPLSSSKEIIFIDSTASCETSSSTITIMLSATKVGALPLAVMIHASQCMQNYINAFELLKMNFPQCFGGQDHPDIFMSDDSSAEKGALAAVWPEAKQLLCHFHVAQAEWRWLFSHKMMEQEEKSTFMKLFQAVQVMYADSEENLLDAEKNLLLKCKNYPDYVKRFRNFLARKKEWILLFRKDLITRNNNTNNFSEASIRILKDVILSRTRAFNVIALCEFFLGVWEEYFTKKLFEFATSRRSSVTVFYDKIRKKSSNFTENDLKDLSNNLFKINSGEHTYIIKTDVGVCSCPSGLTGAFCKHQCALMELKKIRLPNAPPVTPEDKHELALLALGPKCPPKDFFCNFKNQLSSATVESNAFELPIEQETDNNAHSNNEGQ